MGCLASGGMAEVWLARAKGIAGFEKLVVLKTIRPEFAGDASFVEMFLNEARVAALLNHPNCVQIFDVGEDAGTHYLAMEFIDGFALSRVTRRAAGRGRPMPIDLLTRIVVDVASGLDHAHRLARPDGRPLGLVHRDVSLDNILVSFSGQTKVVDFGIAKAADAHGQGPGTRTGRVKGKCGYMAPEYLRGQTIDARADVFALGVVTYRMLTGTKPFTGATDAVVIKAVLDEDPVPPRRINPAIPASLEPVVLRAMHKDLQRRYPTAPALALAVEAAVGRPAEARDLAGYLEQLWPEHDPERARIRQLAAGAAVEAGAPALAPMVSEDVDGGATDFTARMRPAATPRTAQGTGVARAWRAAKHAVRRLPARGVGAGLVAVLLAAGLALGVGRYLRPEAGSELVLAVAPGNRALFMQLYLPVAAYLEREIGRPIRPLIPDSYQEVLGGFLAGRYHIAQLSPVQYVQAKRALPALALLGGRHFGGEVTYRSLLLARHAGPGPLTLESIRGRTVCFVDRSSTSGYVVPAAMLRRAGIDPRTDLGAVRFSGDHFKVLRDLHRGVCAAGAVSSIEYLDAPRQGIPTDEIKVVLESDPLPPTALVAHPSVEPQIRAKLRQAILHAPLEATAGVSLGLAAELGTFADVDDAAYDVIRELADFEPQP